MFVLYEGETGQRPVVHFCAAFTLEASLLYVLGATDGYKELCTLWTRQVSTYFSSTPVWTASSQAYWSHLNASDSGGSKNSPEFFTGGGELRGLGALPVGLSASILFSTDYHSVGRRKMGKSNGLQDLCSELSVWPGSKQPQ
jgi:hypothetical protein